MAHPLVFPFIAISKFLRSRFGLTGRRLGVNKNSGGGFRASIIRRMPNANFKLLSVALL